MVRDRKEDDLMAKEASARPAVRVLGLGLISFASAVAGGLTVAWWYRKTLTKLQNPIGSVSIPKSESDGDMGEL